MYKFYVDLSYEISCLITKTYSTSFSVAVKMLENDQRLAISAIYGFVRLADEIVDTFHNSDKAYLLDKFVSDYYEALKDGVSLNPVLNCFAITINQYKIPDELVQSFLNSMKLDLHKSDYISESELKAYIYGSADVVGLMCLCVFANGDKSIYNKLKEPAMKLGAAFQKVNFLRDLKSDIEELNRGYFPQINKDNFDETSKKLIIDDILKDFAIALRGVKQLPGRSKLAVFIAYTYYLKLTRKLQNTPSEQIIQNRIRVSSFMKSLLFAKAFLMYKFKLI